MTRHCHVLVIILCWVCVACAAPAGGATLVIDNGIPDVTHTLTLQVDSATASTGRSSTGQLVVTSRRHGDTQLVTMATQGSITPNWLIPFGGTLTTITTPTQTWQQDGTCMRDGSMTPAISMRDVLGPMSGFIPAADDLVSNTGGATWQQFTASARRNTQGQLIGMSGRGRGKILVPGGVVVTGTIVWTYTTQPDTTPIVVLPRCSDAVFADVALPARWHNRRPYAGAILAESDDDLGNAADTLQAFLQTQHWQTHITQRDHHTIVMQASRNNETIQLFLVSNEQSGVELTMIVAP